MDIVNNDLTNIINQQIENEKENSNSKNNNDANANEADVVDDEEDNQIEIFMQNVVATVNLGCTIDLEKIAQTARNAGM